MASDSQIGSGSIFGRDRRRKTCENRKGQNGLIDSDEIQPPSQPVDHEMVLCGSSDAMGNPSAKEVLSLEDLWLVKLLRIWWYLH